MDEMQQVLGHGMLSAKFCGLGNFILLSLAGGKFFFTCAAMHAHC